MTIDIDNRQDLDVSFEIIEKVITLTLAEKNAEEVSVSIVSNDEIRELNKRYRGIDAPTDVLSFPMDDRYLGDIIISMEKAAEQAAEYGHGIERELGFLTAHGMLHLLGHDHETEHGEREMLALQERILTAAGLGRD